MSPTTDIVYKLIPPEIWNEAISKGEIPFNALDESDGFMHLSTQSQYMETANLHYTEYKEVLAIEIDIMNLVGDIRWESAKKRNNTLFPHLYGTAPVSSIKAVYRLTKNNDDGPFTNTGAIAQSELKF